MTDQPTVRSVVRRPIRVVAIMLVALALGTPTSLGAAEPDPDQGGGGLGIDATEVECVDDDTRVEATWVITNGSDAVITLASITSDGEDVLAAFDPLELGPGETSTGVAGATLQVSIEGDDAGLGVALSVVCGDPFVDTPTSSATESNVQGNLVETPSEAPAATPVGGMPTFTG